MTKFKQVVIAAGLVAVGYRLGAKSPAAAATGGSTEFRDEVTPGRKPSSKSESTPSVEAPQSLPQVTPSLPMLRTGTPLSTGARVYKCGMFEKKWLDKNVYTHFQKLKDDEKPQLLQEFDEHFGQALHVSKNWRGSARFMVDADVVFVDVLYTLREVNDKQCWDVRIFSTQNEQDVRFLTYEGNCGGDSYNVQWVNNRPVLRLMTNFIDGVGSLISAVALPLDPQGYEGQFEYLDATNDTWVSAGPMIVQPLSDESLAEMEKGFWDKVKAGGEVKTRSPASDP